MAYTHASGGCGFSSIDSVDDTAQAPLGTIVTAQDPSYGVGEFIYLKGVASTVVGSVVHFNYDDHSTALAAADGIGPIATAMAATVADKFGWYQISGKGVAKVAALFADNGVCYLTATDGTIDDAVVPGDRIKNMKGASAIDGPGTGLADVEMSRPFTDDIAD